MALRPRGAASGGSSSRAGDSTFDTAVKRAGRPQLQQHAGEGPRFLEDSAFSEDFCRFLQTSVPTVDAAELLLALAAEPQRRWRPGELAHKLRPATMVSEPDVAGYLDRFQAAGLVAADPDGRLGYRAKDDALAAHVQMLAQAYRERPVTLFRVIYALRDLKIHYFADAFKLRSK